MRDGIFDYQASCIQSGIPAEPAPEPDMPMLPAILSATLAAASPAWAYAVEELRAFSGQ